MPFLPGDAMRKRGLCCRPVSVRLSVTLVDCIHTAVVIVKPLFRPDRPITLVFDPARRYPIPRGTLPAETQNTRGGGKNLRFSTEITAYLGNGTR